MYGAFLTPNTQVQTDDFYFSLIIFLSLVTMATLERLPTPWFNAARIAPLRHFCVQNFGDNFWSNSDRTYRTPLDDTKKQKKKQTLVIFLFLSATTNPQRSIVFMAINLINTLRTRLCLGICSERLKMKLANISLYTGIDIHEYGGNITWCTQKGVGLVTTISSPRWLAVYSLSSLWVDWHLRETPKTRPASELWKGSG